MPAMVGRVLPVVARASVTCAVFVLDAGIRGADLGDQIAGQLGPGAFHLVGRAHGAQKGGGLLGGQLRGGTAWEQVTQYGVQLVDQTDALLSEVDSSFVQQRQHSGVVLGRRVAALPCSAATLAAAAASITSFTQTVTAAPSRTMAPAARRRGMAKRRMIDRSRYIWSIQTSDVR